MRAASVSRGARGMHVKRKSLGEEVGVYDGRNNGVYQNKNRQELGGI